MIESVAAHGGPTATIKTHHNVGGLPDELGFELVEPLRELFKDEVRTIGRAAGLPERMVNAPAVSRGPASRSASSATSRPSACDTLREADKIIQDEIRAAGALHQALAEFRRAAARSSRWA